jgi:hypothetical protein
MKSIRKFVYAALVMLSALNFAPTFASAQDAAGTFTLTHEVHWQSAIVAAGKYRFSTETRGPSEMLRLRNVSGSGASFMLLVPNTEASQPSDLSQIVLITRSSGSYVSTMQLPESGLTLHFTVPTGTREMAQSISTATESVSR